MLIHVSLREDWVVAPRLESHPVRGFLQGAQEVDTIYPKRRLVIAND
jgi:hypothetical protein